VWKKQKPFLYTEAHPILLFMKIKSVAFFGGAASGPEDKEYKAAYEVAKAVAKSGRIIVNGGGPGIMMAATEGAREGGGKVSVVYYRPELATNFKGEIASNMADESFEESNYIDRTQRLLQMSDAYVVFNGGTGTISEFAMAWGVARLYIDHHKPLLLYGDFWYPIMEGFAKNMNIRPDELRAYQIAASPEVVVSTLEKYEKLLESVNHDHTKCVGPECDLML